MSAAPAIIEQTTELQPVQQSEAAAIIQVIERAAMNPNVDIDKMERLLQMQERVIERNAKAAFNAAFARMQPDLPAIEKNGKSNNGAYGLWEDIQGGIQPVLAKHGFALSFKTKVEQDAITVTAILHHEEGHDDSTDLKLPTDNRKPEQKISPATVNRTMTQRLRSILIRAAKIWKVRTGEVIWSAHLLRESGERIREASRMEEAKIMSQLDRGYDTAVQFAFLSGCRRMEILGLEWSRVDFFGRAFSVIGKGGKTRIIPMSQAIFDLLWQERGHHEVKVFTYEAKRTLKNRGLCRGLRYPLTEAGLKTAMRRAVADAGVENFRFHDTRHTAATRILRASNLRVAQKLLGHEDIATTTKYAHALVDDVRNAMDAMNTARDPAPLNQIKTASE